MRRIDGYKSINLAITSFESAIVQTSNQWLRKRRDDDCINVKRTVTIVESTIMLIISKKVFLSLDVTSVPRYFSNALLVAMSSEISM